VNLVPGGATGLFYQLGAYIQGPGPKGWGLKARLMTLLSKKIILGKSKRVKADGLIQVWQNVIRKATAQKG
jgi:hypothetical protein